MGGALLGALACGQEPTRAEGVTTTGGAATTTSATAKTEVEPAFPEPVYPRTNEAPEPLAVRFCDALHALPAKKKAECCGGEAGITMAGECARILSYALRSKAIVLDPADVERCAEASAKAHEGCDWVTPLSARAPAACVGIVKGAMKEGDRCRSSLECEEGLRCHGVAASDTGRCGKPKVAGACSRGIDTLASHTRQTDVERKHPECAGHCNGRRCEADVPLGGACAASLECGEGRRCVEKRCSDAPLPGPGEACFQGVCANDARCVSGACAAPKKNGEACTQDVECAGICEKPVGNGSAPAGSARSNASEARGSGTSSLNGGGAPGVCAMLCSARIPGAATR